MSTALAEVAGVLGAGVAQVRPVGGGCVCVAHRVTLTDGRCVFVKTRAGAPGDFFAVEAAGLALLATVPGGAPVPEVLAVTAEALALEWVEPGAATRDGAEAFGRALAATHRGAPVGSAFGAAGDGYIGPLPLPNGPGRTWARFYAERRLRPYLRRAVDRAAIGDADRAAVETLLTVLVDDPDRIAGPPEPAALLHGDLWSGNVHWSGDTAGTGYLIDPATHLGHRETDLAMLALFGAPYLDRLLAAYEEVFPLPGGRADRMGLHQLHPVLVHAALFGGGYGARAGALARQVLAP